LVASPQVHLLGVDRQDVGQGGSEGSRSNHADTSRYRHLEVLALTYRGERTLTYSANPPSKGHRAAQVPHGVAQFPAHLRASHPPRGAALGGTLWLWRLGNRQ